MFFFLIIPMIMSCAGNEKLRVIDVSDHGIISNTGESITAAINRLIEDLDEGPVTIVFPKGRYDFYPDSGYLKHYYETNTYDVNPKRLAIFLENKKNISIDGQGSEFVYHGHIQPFTLDNSMNITIRNVNIDWDKPLTAEAEVLEADSRHILIKIDTSQFPYEVYEKGITFKAEGWEADWKLTTASWLIEMRKHDHIIPANTGDSGCVRGNVEEVVYIDREPGIVLMEGEFTKTPAVGNMLILRHSTRDHAGMFLFHSKDVWIENINIHHTSGLGILSQYCENITMIKVNHVPNPKKNRYLAGHDDALHFMACRGQILIDSCRALGLMDDPINVHGTCVPVLERTDEKTLVCRFSHGMSKGLIWAEPGDTISFIERKPMVPAGTGIISAFEPVDENQFILTFKQDLPGYVGEDYTLENLSWTPDVTIRNCFAGSCRARGYLISTPGKVIIENNVFESSGSAILIAGDANHWFESGACTDVTIRNNEFRWPCNSAHYQFCKAIIAIYPEIPEPDPSRPFHRNIMIENNTFNPSDYSVLHALSIDGLTFRNNTITRSYEYEPWHYQKHNLHIVACRNVEISGNRFGEDVLGKNILLEGMNRDELRITNKEFSIEEIELGKSELMVRDDALVPED